MPSGKKGPIHQQNNNLDQVVTVSESESKIYRKEKRLLECELVDCGCRPGFAVSRQCGLEKNYLIFGYFSFLSFKVRIFSLVTSSGSLIS